MSLVNLISPHLKIYISILIIEFWSLKQLHKSLSSECYKSSFLITFFIHFKFKWYLVWTLVFIENFQEFKGVFAATSSFLMSKIFSLLIAIFVHSLSILFTFDDWVRICPFFVNTFHFCWSRGEFDEAKILLSNFIDDKSGQILPLLWQWNYNLRRTLENNFMYIFCSF